VLGFLLLDDRFLSRFVPRGWRQAVPSLRTAGTSRGAEAVNEAAQQEKAEPTATRNEPASLSDLLYRYLAPLQLALTGVMFAWLFYSSTALLVWMIAPGAPLPSTPVVALEPFRIADRYGLFARMTRGRYEIEFQGSQDGQNWTTYPFRYKPQDPRKAPGIYAPYQPRFDWNLWFASLGDWRSNSIVPRTEERLLAGSQDVLALFAANPFPQGPPRQVRAVIWQYWFSTPEQKRTQGVWWTRKYLGLYAPTLERESDGKIVVTEWPTALEPRE
jgi:lipase maturation factor 1